MNPDDANCWANRQRAQAWLRAVARGGEGELARSFQVRGRRVLVMESGRFAAGQRVEGFLVVRGDFSCGPGCHFEAPVYVAGNCEIGKGSRLESIETDGRLHLSPAVTLAGNAGSFGPLEIRSGCRIGGRAYSKDSIRLALQASVRDLFAPRIVTPAGFDEELPSEPAPRRKTPVIPNPNERLDRGLFQACGFDPVRLRIRRGHTWVYDGDLQLLRPVLLRAPLVVGGSLTCRPGSLFAGDVSAAGMVAIGAGSVIRGSLAARGDLLLGPGCVFQRELRSGQMMRLAAGVRGLSGEGPVEAWAAGEIELAEDVVVRGRLRSGCSVTAMAGEAPVSRRFRLAEGL